VNDLIAARLESGRAGCFRRCLLVGSPRGELERAFVQAEIDQQADLRADYLDIPRGADDAFLPVDAQDRHAGTLGRNNDIGHVRVVANPTFVLLGEDLACPPVFEIELDPLGTIEVDRDQTIVSVVGNEIAKTEKILSRLFESMEGIPVRMVSYGGSPHNVSLLVPSSFKTKTLQVLNKGIFGLE